MTARILIVEDRASLRRMLDEALRGEGYEIVAAEDGTIGIERLAGDRFDLVLTDLKLPGASGLEVLAAARARQPDTPVVLLTGYGTVATAVEAMKQGAYDFLEKPVEIEDLFRLVAAALGERDSDLGDEDDGAEPLLSAPGAPPIIGRHPRLRAAARLLSRVASKQSTVLLTGESGTGKELFARALHALSPRRKGPFAAVNCAAIPEALMENELFGHEKGAFTGADRRQPGRFELAAGGTLLLDEVGELAPRVQAKVLRVLEEKTFERVGSGRTHTANVRLVAATNRDLETMVDEGAFRSDLFFRLNVFPIELPPLRERASDVPLLARHLLQRIGERIGSRPPRLDDEVVDLLCRRPWPGNVRELANVLERAAIVCEGDSVSATDLETILGAAELRPAGDPGPPGAGARGEERAAVRRALTEAGGDKQRAAELLGLSYRTLQRRVRELDLEGVPKYREG